MFNYVIQWLCYLVIIIFIVIICLWIDSIDLIGDLFIFFRVIFVEVGGLVIICVVFLIFDGIVMGLILDILDLDVIVMELLVLIIVLNSMVDFFCFKFFIFVKLYSVYFVVMVVFVIFRIKYFFFFLFVLIYFFCCEMV